MATCVLVLRLLLMASGLGHAEHPTTDQIQSTPGVPVVLDDLGPSSLAQIPSGLPADLVLRQKQFLIRNLSSQDILFYTIAYVNQQGEFLAQRERSSFQPEQSPVLAAGASDTITRRYVDKTGTLKVEARIDSVVFADGSSYGPDTLKRKVAYVAKVETRLLQAQFVLELLETQGAEALREHLRRRLGASNPLLSPATRDLLKKANQKLGISENPR